MKAISPKEVKIHPWGNQPLQSQAHAEWLASKLIKKANSEIKKQYSRNGSYDIELKSDLKQFKQVAKLIEKAFESAGWSYVAVYDTSKGSCLVVTK